MTINGQTHGPVSASVVRAEVARGTPLMVMTFDQKSGWVTPEAAGLAAPASPAAVLTPTPAAPSAAPIGAERAIAPGAANGVQPLNATEQADLQSLMARNSAGNTLTAEEVARLSGYLRRSGPVTG